MRDKLSRFVKGHRIGMTGRHPTEETKQKMSLAHKGLKHTEESKKRMSESHIGKKHPHSEETKRKIGRAMEGRCCGVNNHNWKGERCKTKEYRRMKSKRYRDRKGKQYVQFCNSKRRKQTKDLSIKTIQLVYEDNIKRFGTLTCYLCLNPIVFGQDSLEHKQPLSRGGTNEYNNLAVACRRCNNKKNTKTYEEFISMKRRQKCHQLQTY